MTETTLLDLQASIQDKSAFSTLTEYFCLSDVFLEYIARTQPARIVSPTHTNYIFYQYSEEYGYRLTRPLNTNLFVEQRKTFKSNHFLGYTVAPNQLDGVYYVDPRPEMITNERLSEQIRDFQTFLVRDLWRLSGG